MSGLHVHVLGSGESFPLPSPPLSLGSSLGCPLLVRKTSVQARLVCIMEEGSEDARSNEHVFDTQERNE